jgi:hypothetical protein
MNTRFWVILVITMCAGSYTYQPAYGQCVTNKVKGATFSNCGEGALGVMQKSDGVKFKESAGDDGLSQHLDGKSSVRFKEDAPEKGKDGAKPVDKKNLPLFKETSRDPESNKDKGQRVE